MVDVPVLGTGVSRRVGSSPTKGNTNTRILFEFHCLSLFRSLRVEANVMFVENKALHQWFSKIKRFDTINLYPQ